MLMPVTLITWRAKEGRPIVEEHPWIYNVFKVNLDKVRPYLEEDFLFLPLSNCFQVPMIYAGYYRCRRKPKDIKKKPYGFLKETGSLQI